MRTWPSSPSIRVSAEAIAGAKFAAAANFSPFLQFLAIAWSPMFCPCIRREARVHAQCAHGRVAPAAVGRQQQLRVRNSQRLRTFRRSCSFWPLHLARCSVHALVTAAHACLSIAIAHLGPSTRSAKSLASHGFGLRAMCAKPVPGTARKSARRRVFVLHFPPPSTAHVCVLVLPQMTVDPAWLSAKPLWTSTCPPWRSEACVRVWKVRC